MVIHQGIAVEFQYLVVGGLGVDLEVGLAGQDLDQQALVVEGVADGLLNAADGLGVLQGQHGKFLRLMKGRGMRAAINFDS